ncbi:tetratricopeptide repeat protein [Aquimarina pacifica]|uniref:tetratricopeptide repeat protein n=1 Tax=Aquimarina pacifica TaxID=1296415 RepID=UPI0004707C10|nr:hypothetical protein [Aquimarina pacifica]
MLCFYALYPQDAKKYKRQIHEIDSLSKIAKKDLIGNGDLLHETLKMSRSIKYVKGELRSLINLGTYYTNNALIDSAKATYDKSEHLIRQYPQFTSELPYIFARKADILKNQGAYNRALNYYNMIYEINVSKGNKKDILATKMNILSCHLSLGEADKVLAYSKELLRDSVVNKYDDLQYLLYDNLALAYFNKKEFGKAINWWEANLKSVEKSKKIGTISYVLNSIADAYRSIGNYEIALEKINKSEQIIKNKPAYSSQAASNALVLGKIYNSLENPKEAIIHFENAILQNPDDPMDLILAHKHLGALYKRIGKPEISSDHYYKYGSLANRLYKKRNVTIAKISNEKAQLAEERFKNNQLIENNGILNEKNDEQKGFIIFLSISLFISIITAILFYVAFPKKQKNTDQEQIPSSDTDDEKVILENQIQNREEEFLATLLSINEKLNKLTLIKKYLSSAIKYNNKKELLEAEKKLGQLISSTSDIGILKDRIESQYPGITGQIHACYPNLSPNDTRHCLLVKLNLSIKESAELLGVSTHAVKMARKRVKKKIGIPEDISLKEHLRDMMTTKSMSIR